ncbi:MAG: hypothetical protein AB4063_21100 [Crocosphaera sp.]
MSKNIAFDELISLVQAFGFTLSKVNGSDGIFIFPLTEETSDY